MKITVIVPDMEDVKTALENASCLAEAQPMIEYLLAESALKRALLNAADEIDRLNMEGITLAEVARETREFVTRQVLGTLDAFEATCERHSQAFGGPCA